MLRPSYTKAVKLPLEPSSTAEDIIGKALGYIELEVCMYRCCNAVMCCRVSQLVDMYVRMCVRGIHM